MNGREVAASERQSLTNYLSRLNLWLAGCDPKETYPLVATLRAVMARNTTNESQEVAVLQAYGSVLSPLPLWAVKRACEAFMQGDERFAPTPGQIASKARSLMTRYVEDRARIERALGVVSHQTADDEALR